MFTETGGGVLVQGKKKQQPTTPQHFSIQTSLRGCTVLASVQGSEAGTPQLEIKSSLIFYETGIEQTTGIFGVYPQLYKSDQCMEIH